MAAESSVYSTRKQCLSRKREALDFCMQITRDACLPYFEMIDKWIAEGIISDQLKQFFIEDTASGSEEIAICPTDE